MENLSDVINFMNENKVVLYQIPPFLTLNEVILFYQYCIEHEPQEWQRTVMIEGLNKYKNILEEHPTLGDMKIVDYYAIGE